MATCKLPQKITPASLALYFEQEAPPVIGTGVMRFKDNAREYLSVSEQLKHKLSREGETMPLDLDHTDFSALNDGLNLQGLSGDDAGLSLNDLDLWDDNPFTNYIS